MWSEVPAAWRIERLENMCLVVTSGGTPARRQSGRYYAASGHPWVKTKELHDQRITSTEERITDDGLAESSAKLLPKNTVLVAMLRGDGWDAWRLGHAGSMQPSVRCIDRR